MCVRIHRVKLVTLYEPGPWLSGHLIDSNLSRLVLGAIIKKDISLFEIYDFLALVFLLEISIVGISDKKSFKHWAHWSFFIEAPKQAIPLRSSIELYAQSLF